MGLQIREKLSQIDTTLKCFTTTNKLDIINGIMAYSTLTKAENDNSRGFWWVLKWGQNGAFFHGQMEYKLVTSWPCECGLHSCS